MKHTVAIYCPDQHFQYNLHTLNEEGVGGGITARIRMAHALARLGHQVSVYINCPRNETIQGIRYHHFSKTEHFAEEIFIASTSGRDLDLGSLADKKIDAKLKILMVHGVLFPNNIEPEFFDSIYALSNFVRKIAVTQWKMDPGKLFVAHRGVAADFYQPRESLERNPFKLVYCGHPSKGLDAAIEVLRMLRKADERYTLHVFGGSSLWGEPEGEFQKQAGLVYHGLVGQRQLAQRLLEMGFSLNLQFREEPFGMVVIESMRAGCIVLASPVGAYPELICNGYNGILVPGTHTEIETCALAARIIMELNRHPGYSEYIRRNAISSPLTWDVLAHAWSGHWDWLLGLRSLEVTSAIFERCSICNGNWLMLADGLHCAGCGQYQKYAARIEHRRGYDEQLPFS